MNTRQAGNSRSEWRMILDQLDRIVDKAEQVGSGYGLAEAGYIHGFRDGVQAVIDGALPSIDRLRRE